MKSAFKPMRERSGMTQAEVAERLGLRQTSVSMWETGDAFPRAEMLPKIASLYGCTIDDLLQRTENSAEASA